MKKLQENGLIKRVGADKNGYWQVMQLKFAVTKSKYISEVQVK